MEATFSWDIAGVIVLLVLSLVGLARWMIVRMDKSSDILHKRINDVKEKYVRRDDLDTRLDHIEKTQDRMYQEQRDHAQHVSKRLDSVMSSITKVATLIAKNGEKNDDG